MQAATASLIQDNESFRLVRDVRVKKWRAVDDVWLLDEQLSRSLHLRVPKYVLFRALEHLDDKFKLRLIFGAQVLEMSLHGSIIRAFLVRSFA